MSYQASENRALFIRNSRIYQSSYADPLPFLFAEYDGFRAQKYYVSIATKNVYDLVRSEKSLSAVFSKEHKMQEKYTYGLWGAAGGAIVLAVVGFSWGDWYTSKGAAQHAQAAVSMALLPACAKDVMADPTSAAELKTKRVSDYDDVVRDYRKRSAA